MSGFSPEITPRIFGFLWIVKADSFFRKLTAFIQKNHLFGKEEKLLCAVSGGPDSMVLAHGLHRLGYSLEIAHVNYGLRGSDSDLDEELVRAWAEKNRLPFHLRRAGEGLKKMQGSLQENARNFRYEWLENLAEERGISHLVLAHHAGDQVETFLLQLFRGAGVRGLSAMPASAGIRRRPLLCFSKEELEALAIAEGLEWRRDLSNDSDDYRRNQVRHHLLPLLQNIFPGFEEVVQRNLRRMQLASKAHDFLYRDLYEKFLKKEKSGMKEFRLDAVADHPLAAFFITELLERHGFHFEDAASFSSEIMKTESRVRTNGKGLVAEFRFPRLLLRKQVPEAFLQLQIENAFPCSYELMGGKRLVCFLHSEPASQEDMMTWSFPVENLRFPLLLRTRKAGDRMAVRGMGGKRKKISDILSEARQSPGEKAGQYVLEDANGTIRWLPGLRKSEEKPQNAAGSYVILRLEEG